MMKEEVVSPNEEVDNHALDSDAEIQVEAINLDYQEIFQNIKENELD